VDEPQWRTDTVHCREVRGLGIKISRESDHDLSLACKVYTASREDSRGMIQDGIYDALNVLWLYMAWVLGIREDLCRARGCIQNRSAGLRPRRGIDCKSWHRREWETCVFPGIPSYAIDIFT
jgi:hypothetical protein